MTDTVDKHLIAHAALEGIKKGLDKAKEEIRQKAPKLEAASLRLIAKGLAAEAEAIEKKAAEIEMGKINV